MNKALPFALWLVLNYSHPRDRRRSHSTMVGFRPGTGPQHLALAEMLVTQFVATTLLFPWLLRGGSGLAVAFTSLPFIQLAALLTSTPAAASIAVSLHLVMWIIGLTTWTALLRSRISQAIAIAVLGGVVIGGPLLTYLAENSQTQQDMQPGTLRRS